MRTARQFFLDALGMLAPLSEYDEREKRFLLIDLIGAVLSINRSEWLLKSEEIYLTLHQEEILGKQLYRLATGEPIQYIVGAVPFGPLSLYVERGVLIPRPETEYLCLQYVESHSHLEKLTILDACAGTGAIALYLASALNNAEIYALEKYPLPLQVLHRNIERYEKRLAPSRVYSIAGDLLQPTFAADLPPLDLLISNPPYLLPCERGDMAKHVIDHEPHEALFAPSEEPLYFYHALASLASLLHFKPSASIYMEVNSLLAQEVKEIFTILPFVREITILKDLAGKERFVIVNLK